MFVKILKFFLIEFFYNGHLQSFSASGVVYFSSYFILGRSADLPLILIVYLTFQFVYFNDRFRNIDLDRITNSTRSSHILNYVKHVPKLMLGYAFLTILLSLIYSNIYTLISSVFIMFMGYLYPQYFKLLTKKIYLFKNIYVSLVFGLITFFPFIYHQVMIRNIFAYLLAGYFFIETMIMQIVLDCKDVLSDRKQKLLTLPVMIGKENTIRFLIVFTSILYVVFLLLIKYLGIDMVFLELVIFFMMLNFATLYLLWRDDNFSYIISASKNFLGLLLLLILE